MKKRDAAAAPIFFSDTHLGVQQNHPLAARDHGLDTVRAAMQVQLLLFRGHRKGR
jgi:hypothetical protein